MKIQALGMHTEPGCGGVDRYFLGLLSGLQSCGADVSAAAFGPPNPDFPHLHSLGPAGLSSVARYRAVRKFAGIRRGDVICSHFALYALPLLTSLRSRCHVVHFHGPWAIEASREHAPPWNVAAKYLTERVVYATARRFIVLSSAFRDILSARYGVDPTRISLIPGGIDTDHFRPMDRAAARRQMNWPADGKIIFCVRRLVHRMGLEHLIDALPSLPGATLIIGGQGPLAPALKARSASLDLAGRVIFAGFIPEKDLPAAYAAADFSVVPSESLEGFGLAALESLACGRPALVTPVGGLPEVVHDLDPSLVLRGSLAEGLARAVAHPEALPSENQCRLHAMKFRWDHIARQVLEVYSAATHG